MIVTVCIWFINMKDSLILSRTKILDPIQSRSDLSDFSSRVKKSQTDLRRNEAQDELYCELCKKMFTLLIFKLHLEEHRRPRQYKIPRLEEVYQNIEGNREPESRINSLYSMRDLRLE